jgi:hypothetical protein
MASVAYFRRQADLCLRLSLLASEDEVSNRLVLMAREYMATAESLESSGGGNTDATERAPLGATAGLSGATADC